MNRRSFIAGLTALVGGIALQQAIPFNRVWSFPSKIVIPEPEIVISQGNTLLTVSQITRQCLKILQRDLNFCHATHMEHFMRAPLHITSAAIRVPLAHP